MRFLSHRPSIMETEDPSELGDWLKQRVLGSGGFGVVTLWKNKQTGETIALKKCRSGTDSIMTPKHKERWTKEVEIMQRLSHPNVVKAIQVPWELSILRSELPLLCMEFCSKGDLRQVLNKRENCCGLNEADVRALISDVKSAIQYLHTMKITHRDLKPENIVLQQKEKKIVYKLIDLGYAKELEQSSLCTSFVGTLQYLAPELFTNKPYTSSVDYWSLGLLSHEVITGVRPFLPNMTPAAWMSHVRNKSSDDICAYQAPDGSIVFSKELYDQNHISLALKHDMERWLKLALEWDPKKRGRGPGDKVIIFDMLDEILSKKIVQLFVVPLYLHCSYVVDSSTALSTLQVWLERDTALAVNDQELLLPSGKPPEPDAGAMQCWNQKCIEDGTPMLLVFRKGELTLPQVGPRIPWTVQQMLQEPRTKLEYVHLRRAWAHASFFLRQEADLYCTLVAAFQTKMKHVEELGNIVTENLKDAVTSLQRVEAQMDIVHSSLKLDEEKAAGRVIGSVMHRWSRGFEQIKSRVETLHDVLLQDLKTRSERTSSKLLKLQEEPTPPWQEMEMLSESGLKCYDQLRRRSRESRQQKSDCIEMLKIVYSCLKRRDALLRDKAFSEQLTLLAVLQKDLEMLDNPINRAIELIEKISVELKEEQLKRQNDIWRSVMGQDATQNSVGHVSPSPSLYLDELKELQVPELTVTDFKIGSFMPDRNLADGNLSRTHSREETPTPNELRVSRESSPHLAGRVSPFAVSDATTIVQDNFELRFRTEELLNQSFQQIRSIMGDFMSMDWTHLEQ
ncbi:inhibitor of nuclear factor kappa-B kinase subunit alpha isoform X2 [Schistocerca cancellata]|uniref:inhibitor of nuclear factor kappa-B kinase subunit alpha isoform X2 n=1 Tax=Schistocerca cancellata TaxID=274614 RepID=UPI00211772BB|nr:inhibitor of nuclear factor kappa-B kinase subunit alpha isoform X2 [Schistocerca cancellata]